MRTYTVCKIAIMQVIVSAVLIRFLHGWTTVAAGCLECTLPGLIPSIADTTQERRQLLVAHGPDAVGVGLSGCSSLKNFCASGLRTISRSSYSVTYHTFLNAPICCHAITPPSSSPARPRLSRLVGGHIHSKICIPAHNCCDAYILYTLSVLFLNFHHYFCTTNSLEHILRTASTPPCRCRRNGRCMPDQLARTSRLRGT